MFRTQLICSPRARCARCAVFVGSVLVARTPAQSSTRTPSVSGLHSSFTRIKCFLSIDGAACVLRTRFASFHSFIETFSVIRKKVENSCPTPFSQVQTDLRNYIQILKQVHNLFLLSFLLLPLYRSLEKFTLMK